MITRRMMRLRMPDGELPLGGALPLLLDGSVHPTPLRELTHPELEVDPLIHPPPLPHPSTKNPPVRRLLAIDAGLRAGVAV